MKTFLSKFREFLWLLILGLSAMTLGVLAQNSLLFDVTKEGNNIEEKTAGEFVTPFEFNNITGTLRGIYNYENSGNHSFGINQVPHPEIALDVDSPIQLGVMPIATCGINRAGTIYFDSDDNRFWYCNGSVWRALDTNDCTTCDEPKAYEYTCTDEGNGDTVGVWSGGTIPCEPINYNSESETRFYQNNTVCASQIPENTDCFIAGNRTQCENPIEAQYESRCYNANVHWYNDCGERGVRKDSCLGSGCSNITASELLSNGANPNEHPMHPEYNNIIDGSYQDPYSEDDYTTPRNPNVKIQAFCGYTLSCGDEMPTSIAPTELCDGGTPSAVTTDGRTWNWSCTEEGTTNIMNCEAENTNVYHWELSNWGVCQESAGTCTGTYTTTEPFCLALHDNPFVIEFCSSANDQNMCESYCYATPPTSINDSDNPPFVCHNDDREEYPACDWGAVSERSCTGAISEASCETAERSTCAWNSSNEENIQSREVVCRDVNNNIVNDSFCALPKPRTQKNCREGSNSSQANCGDGISLCQFECDGYGNWQYESSCTQNDLCDFYHTIGETCCTVNTNPEGACQNGEVDGW